MKFIISKDGTKRELETPFALCIDTEHLGSLINELRSLHAGMKETGTSYGWIKVDLAHPSDCQPNTKPLPWGVR